MKRKKQTAGRLIEAEDVCRLKIICSGAISPDESRIACIIETVSEDRKKYFSHLHTIDIATGESRQYTQGEVADRAPVWSPDGRHLAFISARDKKTAIYLMPADGGAEKKIIETDGAVTGLTWTPDGRELVYAFRRNDSHQEKDEIKKKETPLFRHITRLLYRLDGAGWMPKDRFHIWKVNVASGKSRQLTRGKYDDMMPAVSANGKWIAYISNHSREPDLEVLRDDLFVIPVSGGAAHKIPTPAGPKLSAVFSPDGKKIAYLGHDRPDDEWGKTNIHLWIAGFKGRSAARNLIKRFDRTAIDMTLGDLVEGDEWPSLHWSADGRRLYFTAADRGSTHLFYVPAEGGTPTRITHRNCHVRSFSMAGRKKVIVAVISDLKNPGDLYILPPRFKGDSRARRLTDINKKLLAQVRLPAVREVWFKAHDGNPLQGWLVTPPNFNRKRKYPAILEIHGGPRMQYGFTFFHEMLYLASRGYVVFYTNPRGGSGRGETFAAAISGAWGEIDFHDCMAAADYLGRL
ncbi:MAG: S9 family peptidase, partial [Candidatus Zixiibacteriota bacterium]